MIPWRILPVLLIFLLVPPSFMFGRPSAGAQAFLSRSASVVCRRQRFDGRVFSSSNHNLPTAQLITSTKSTTMKRIKQILQSAKKRRAAGVTVVESPRAVLDLLQNTNTATHCWVEQILITDTVWDTYVPQIQDILVTSSQQQTGTEPPSPPRLTPVTTQVLDDLADTVTPQGMLALVTIPDASEQLLQRQSTSNSNPHPLYLILDGVADPGNLGTLLRSAAAVGVRAVLTLPGTADPYAPKALRSAMGCTFYVPIQACSSYQQAVQQIQTWHATTKQNKNENTVPRIWAATMEHDIPGTPYFHVNWTVSTDANSSSAVPPAALIVGNEGNGLSDEVRTALRTESSNVQAVYVPMQPHVESLNAAVCASIILFDYYRQVQQQQE